MSWCLFCHFPLAEEHRMVFWADQVLSLKSSSVYCSLLVGLRRTSLLQVSESIPDSTANVLCVVVTLIHTCISGLHHLLQGKIQLLPGGSERSIKRRITCDLSLYYSLTITATSWMFNVTERYKENNYQCFCVFLRLDKDSGGRKDNFRHVCI